MPAAASKQQRDSKQPDDADLFQDALQVVHVVVLEQVDLRAWKRASKFTIGMQEATCITQATHQQSYKPRAAAALLVRNHRALACTGNR